MFKTETDFKYIPQQITAFQKAEVRSETEHKIIKEVIQYINTIGNVYVTEIPPFTENGPSIPPLEFNTHHNFRRKLTIRLTANTTVGFDWIYNFVYFINNCLSDKRKTHPGKVTFEEKYHPIEDYPYGEINILIPDSSSEDFFTNLSLGIKEGIKQVDIAERAYVNSSNFIKSKPNLKIYNEEACKELLEELDQLPGLIPIELRYNEYKEQGYYVSYMDVSFVVTDETGIYCLNGLWSPDRVNLTYTFGDVIFKNDNLTKEIYKEAPVWVLRFNLKNLCPDFTRAVQHVKSILENFNDDENADYDREDFSS